jgi:hypothetical protein
VKHQALLSCYKDAGKEVFTCDLGVQLVRDGRCQSERDALYECQLPGTKDCMTSCRELQATFDSPMEPAAQGLSSVVGGCSFMTNSCEDTCWVMVLFEDDYPKLDAGTQPDAGVPLDAGLKLPNDRWSVLLMDQCLRAALGEP